MLPNALSPNSLCIRTDWCQIDQGLCKHTTSYQCCPYVGSSPPRLDVTLRRRWTLCVYLVCWSQAFKDIFPLDAESKQINIYRYLNRHSTLKQRRFFTLLTLKRRLLTVVCRLVTILMWYRQHLCAIVQQIKMNERFRNEKHTYESLTLLDTANIT